MRLLLVLSLSLCVGHAQAQGASSDTPIAETPPAAAGDATAASEPAPSDGDPPLRATVDEPLPLPKVALVLVGDPDDEAVAVLEALSRALTASGTVRQPADEALRRALAGRGENDGLDEVRGERRGLGLSERRDVPVLLRLGRLATAAAVVVVRRVGEGYEAIVLDIGREAFFDGALALPAAEDETRVFVGRRARVARDAAHVSGSATGGASIGTAAGLSDPVDEIEDPTEDPTEDEEPEPPAGDPVLLWFEQNWAYLAAGALLAGGVAFVVVVATAAGPPQPMLRFVPGGP